MGLLARRVWYSTDGRYDPARYAGHASRTSSHRSRFFSGSSEPRAGSGSGAGRSERTRAC